MTVVTSQYSVETRHFHRLFIVVFFLFSRHEYYNFKNILAFYLRYVTFKEEILCTRHFFQLC